MADSPRTDDSSVSDASENAPSMAEADPSDDGGEYSDESDDSMGLLSISETQDLCNIHYSREATVAAFEDYFEFLTAMYMDPAAIRRPPEGGWPQITVESMRPLGKTDEVVDLLRHLPYIRQDTDDGIQAGGWFVLYNWAQKVLRTGAAAGDCHGVHSHIPSHVVGLSMTRDAEMFLDTRLGVIYFPGGNLSPGPSRVSEPGVGPYPPISDRAQDYAPLEEIDWRQGAWAIPDFFEMLKYHFRELNYIPMSRTEVAEAFDRATEREQRGRGTIYPILRSIFAAHGWPDSSRYRKDDCVNAVELACREYDRVYDEQFAT